MAANDVSVPPEFDQIGIKPLAYGQPEIPKATSYAALARQVERDGIQDEAGNDLARPDAEGAQALARQFVNPRTTAAALKAPLFKHLQAGTVALVHSPVFLTRVNPSLLNPRVAPYIAIPEADRGGHVAVGWAPEDVSEDPAGQERLIQSIASLDQLTESSRETADKVLALQGELAEVIGREGIEEPLLIVMTRLEVDGPDQPVRTIVPVSADGGSRGTICQENLADAIERLLDEKEREYATKHKRRQALELLEGALRVHQPATLIDDPVAERELRDYLVELSYRPAAELVSNRLYAAQRSLVAPALVVVGFRPNGSATIIDAIDQLVTNQHKRGPLQWEPAAQALDSRNSVLRALRRQHKVTRGQAMLLGPRFAEAVNVHNMKPEPDHRIAQAVSVFHGDDARRPLREAFGTAKSRTADRCEVIAAVIGEQVRDADPAFRRQIDTTLRDMLGYSPFYGADVPDMRPTRPRVEELAEMVHRVDATPPEKPGSDVDGLVDLVKRFETKRPNKLTSPHVQLGVKGGVALVLLGALAREHGTSAAEVARPYTVLQRMLHDPFGQELLGEAIKALRAGDQMIPARHPETREPKGRDAENRVVAMTPANLRELFTEDGDDDGGTGNGARTADGILAEMTTVARNKLGLLLAELVRLPDVAKQGIAPHRVNDLIELLESQAGDLEYQGRRGADYLRASEQHADEKDSEHEPDEAEAVL